MSDIVKDRMMIGVDVGGTFTDVVAVRGGEIITVKVQTNVTETERAVIDGAAEVGVGDAILFNHASTHGLNAVITRKLPKIAFLATEGHRDILDRGRVWRPVSALTDPHWRRSFGDSSRPLVPRYLRRGIRERVLADGRILIPLDETQVLEELAILKKCAVQGIAICLLNSYLFSDHERRVRELVRQVLGDIPCSISSEVSPLAKEYPRASTTVIDANMRLIYGAYTANLESGLRDKGFVGDLNYANCAAQLVPSHAATRRPYEIVFSGPAAGTVASAHFGELIGATNLLCADVGGTSCDISLVTAGRPYVNTTFELEHDLIVNALSVEISSIGAGGGSLVSINPAGAVEVGPGSAGSDPGPACYGKGGTEPTMTDTCLLMGIIDPAGFAGGRVPLRPDLSQQAFTELDSRLSFDDRVSYAFRTGLNNIAEGLTDVAVSHGIDLRDYSLLAFGAAGPMLLPAMLDLVQVAEVIVPPHPGLFSALGLVSSDQVYSDRRSAYILLDRDVAERIETIFAEMEANLVAELGARDTSFGFKRTFDGQLLGQSWETPFVPVPEGRLDADAIDRLIATFHETYKGRWGDSFPSLPVQSVTFRVEVIIPSPKVEYPKLAKSDGKALVPSRRVSIRYLQQQPIDAGEYDRALLKAGALIDGPAVIREAMSTTFVLHGQIVRVGDYGELHISKHSRNGATQ